MVGCMRKFICFAHIIAEQKADDRAILFLLLLFSIPKGLTEALCSSETIKQKPQKSPGTPPGLFIWY
jgi:hypothetical protein